jgi:hypothetical protein
LTFGSNGSTRSHNPSETTHGATAIGTPQSLRTDADEFADHATTTFISIRVLSRQRLPQRLAPLGCHDRAGAVLFLPPLANWQVNLRRRGAIRGA